MESRALSLFACYLHDYHDY